MARRKATVGGILPPRILEVAAQVACLQNRRAAIVRRQAVLDTETEKLETELAQLKETQHAAELELSRLASAETLGA